MVGVNVSHSYFHPGGAHITRVKIISHTCLLLQFRMPSCYMKFGFCDDQWLNLSIAMTAIIELYVSYIII